MEEVARSLAPDLWVLDHPLRMPGGFEIGTRSTVIRLADGGLWLHSPGPLTPAVRTWLTENGPLRAIVAPNLLHHLFVRETAKTFPDARVYAAPGLREKLPELSVHAVLGEGEAPWAGEVESLLIPGCPRLNEVVFLHPASRTLVVSDLVFHPMQSDSGVTRLFFRAAGVWKRFGPSRLFRYGIVRDKASLRPAIEQILRWDFDRVVLAHGDVLETGGREALRAGYGWLLA